MKKSSFYHNTLAFDAPVRGCSSRNIATAFGMEKLEWWVYSTVKTFRRYVYSFWHDPQTWQTDGHHMTAIIAALMLMLIARQKPQIALGNIWHFSRPFGNQTGIKWSKTWQSCSRDCERYVPHDHSETLSFGRHFQHGLDSERLSLIS